MPLRFKIPSYLGNTLLLLLGLAVLFQGHIVLGLGMIGLALLDLFLTYKLDLFSREEVWLTHELEMAKMREELAATQRRLAELTNNASGLAPSP